MRLKCPNCGAQYEVPDEVIPFDGRDVQCSNCGDTWFQGHPDNPDTVPDPEDDAAEPEMAAAKADVGNEAEVEVETEVEVEVAVEVETEVEVEPVPQPEPETQDAGDDADADDQAPEPGSPLPDIDSGITDILRQEAEREAKLRAAESGPLESQPDLGLDEVGDAPNQRTEQARSRMARLRGDAADTEAGAGSRRELLPDIEEINSAWSGSDDAAAGSNEIVPAAELARKQRSGFVRGFAMIVIIGVVMALIYANASAIARLIPAAEPALNAYVAMIDQGRIWLDARLGAMVPAPGD